MKTRADEEILQGWSAMQAWYAVREWRDQNVPMTEEYQRKASSASIVGFALLKHHANLARKQR